MQENARHADDLKMMFQKKADEEMERKLDDANLMNLVNKERG